jgi:hypothetical protein
MQLTDPYGSPSLDDIQLVSKRVNAHLLESIGQEAAGDIEISISTPVCPECEFMSHARIGSYIS